MKQPPSWHFTYWFFPLLCVASVFIALAMGPQAVDAWVVSPRGFLENVPCLFLLAGVGYCLAALCDKSVRADKSLRYWIVAYIVASVYFAGEDANWGQYWFNWDTPEFFIEHNKEDETNLHNINSWFNQKPRLVLEI